MTIFRPKIIRVPSDFSSYSEKALEQAVDIARQCGSRVYLFHTIGVIQQCSMDYCIDQSAMDQRESQMTAVSMENFRKQVAALPQAEGVEILLDVKKGYLPEEIMKEQGGEVGRPYRHGLPRENRTPRSPDGECRGKGIENREMCSPVDPAVTRFPSGLAPGSVAWRLKKTQ